MNKFFLSAALGAATLSSFSLSSLDLVDFRTLIPYRRPIYLGPYRGGGTRAQQKANRKKKVRRQMARASRQGRRYVPGISESLKVQLRKEKRARQKVRSRRSGFYRKGYAGYQNW